MEYKNKKAYYKTKTSLGIVICRKNPPSILMVKKRITNQYKEFIFGKYKFFNNYYLQYLLDRMSVNEKLLLLSKSFDKNWYYIWLKIPTEEDKKIYEFYLNCKSKYERFIFGENFKRLKSLINKSSSIESGWEIPGGHSESGESELDTAIREVKEEANIDSAKYDIVYKIRPLIISSINNKTLYVRKYYVASLVVDHQPSVKFYNTNQITEVSDVKFWSLNEIRGLNVHQKNIIGLARRALKLYKKFSKI